MDGQMEVRKSEPADKRHRWKSQIVSKIKDDMLDFLNCTQ